ncbi:MAG TPA: RNA-binding cell elongation regulator Jag/EloR [Actinomycetota bacterium]|nr:RNA-binding cell elongation regulator Jag/EloR [Actinomycetota bacterium]
MSEGVVASGRTVEEAIDRALEMLGATDDEVEVQILSEGTGLQERGEAQVRVRLRDERSEEDLALAREVEVEADDEPAVAQEELQAQAEAAEDFLDGLFEVLDLDADVASTLTSRAAQVEITGPELGLLIGRRGSTLEALQEVTRAAVQRHLGQRAWINLDIEGYRARRRVLVERHARSSAARVRKSGRPMALEPMSAFERKIVHDSLADSRGVRTASEGEGPDRHVVISPE